MEKVERKPSPYSWSGNVADAVLAALRRGCARFLGVMLAMVFALFTAQGARAGDTAISEYQVKAAYLFNFAKFVEWPATKFTNDSAPLIIGILGTNPFAGRLEQAIQGKTISGRQLAVRILLKPEDVNQCHILFVSSPETDRLISALAEIKPEGVLTVGEMAGFAQRGGVINFTLADGTVKFEINPQAAERAGLKISSKLLSVGKIVKSG